MSEKIEKTQKATKKEWIGLAVIALPCLLYAMDLTVLYLAAPQLTADLNPTPSQQLWIMDIYGFLVAGFLVIMGNLGDKIGRRKLLLYGAAAFGVASVLAAFSPSSEILILTRAILGITAATLAPSTLSLIRNMFLDSEERTVAIGIWGMSFSLGGAIGPLVGGVLLEHFWWGSVFLMSVPVMILLLLVGPKLLPEFKDPDAGKMDIPSAILSLISVLSIIYGLKQIAENGWGAIPILTIFAGLTVGAVFIKRQTTLADPMIDLQLFKLPVFTAAVVGNTLTIFVGLGTFLFISQYLQLVLGLSPLEAGLWTLPGAVGNIVGSLTIPILVRNIKPLYVMLGGLVLLAIGMGIYTQINNENGILLIVIGSLIMSFGICTVVILGTDIIVSSAPPERAGAAASISETAAEFGGVLGIAVLGSIGVAIFKSRINSLSLPNLTPEQAESSRNTLASAIAVSKELPEETGNILINTAREAFSDSLHFVSWISVAICIVLAGLIFSILRNKKSSEPENEENMALDQAAR
ncbi:MFS transporter [Leptospira sarikeiensis]|uniref:MFS transporter n=1 Tax=Leptospira sarikeiensis TaxID=2484943 RepID=A0A4R9K9Z5_9LEPT|nr:MFS transporter [Leptospira sarikeiensis]TGL61573.1 MFS transporter [Leptospira sarikeiensis]